MTDRDDRLAVVTGTSSGIGAAVAEKLLEAGWRVAGVSRRPAGIVHPRYQNCCLDLADLAALESGLQTSLGRLVASERVSRLALVNNAADGALIGTVERQPETEVLRVYAVNAVAPLALMGWLLRRAAQGVPVRIVNVSSGAARGPFPGMSAYCSSKAALRMAGMVLASELDGAVASGAPSRDVCILSYEPGMVDTAMQVAARSAPADLLPRVDFFVDAASSGKLVPPSAPASEIVRFLESDGAPRFSEARLGAAAA